MVGCAGVVEMSGSGCAYNRWSAYIRRSPVGCQLGCQAAKPYRSLCQALRKNSIDPTRKRGLWAGRRSNSQGFRSGFTKRQRLWQFASCLGPYVVVDGIADGIEVRLGDFTIGEPHSRYTDLGLKTYPRDQLHFGLAARGL
jgi:hypothetical protein